GLSTQEREGKRTGRPLPASSRSTGVMEFSAFLGGLGKFFCLDPRRDPGERPQGLPWVLERGASLRLHEVPPFAGGICSIHLIKTGFTRLTEPHSGSDQTRSASSPSVVVADERVRRHLQLFASLEEAQLDDAGRGLHLGPGALQQVDRR